MVTQIKESLIAKAFVLVEALEAVSQSIKSQEICLSTDLSGGRRVNFFFRSVMRVNGKFKLLFPRIV